MHTAIVVLEGFVLLAVCLLIARLVTPGADVGVRAQRVYAASKIFIGLWLVCSIVNLWRGVSEGGYTMLGEIPFFVIVFGLPTGVAAVVGMRSLKRVPL